MAHEALNAVIALLFGPLAKHRITAVVDARNLGAAALFGKLGFRREAHWRQNVFLKARGATNSVSLCCKANGGRMQSMALLNKYLGQYQFSERHAITIAAPPAGYWRPWPLTIPSTIAFPQHDSAARVARG